MKIFVVQGYNGILNSAYLAGASKSMAGALAIQKEDEFQADKSKIVEVELVD